jgi:rhodanese-related sulfurtransferase
MAKRGIICIAVAMIMVSVMAIKDTEAFKQVTAQEAYDMVAAGNAAIVDVRTTAEYVWVGTCKLPDGSTPYNIPWKIWAYNFAPTGEQYEAGGIVVEELFGFLMERTFPDKTESIITMCRSGHRSESAAAYLEDMGYVDVYEIDNKVAQEADEAAGTAFGKRGARGGFQGSSGNCPAPYEGYRGWPNRVTPGTVTADLTDKSQSVSWMDTGLPITQKFDISKIWIYMWNPDLIQ